MNSYMLERNAMSIGVIYMLSSTLRYLTVHTKCHKTDYYIYYILVTFKVFFLVLDSPDQHLNCANLVKKFFLVVYTRALNTPPTVHKTKLTGGYVSLK